MKHIKKHNYRAGNPSPVNVEQITNNGNRFTKENAAYYGAIGAKKSAEKKRWKKTIAENYAVVLRDQFNIKNGEGLPAVIEEILNQKEDNRARVQLLKHMEEVEGKKLANYKDDIDILGQLLGIKKDEL